MRPHILCNWSLYTSLIALWQRSYHFRFWVQKWHCNFELLKYKRIVSWRNTSHVQLPERAFKIPSFLKSYLKNGYDMGGSAVKNLPAMQNTQETQVLFLGQKMPWRRALATHCSILARKITRTEEPGGLWSIGLQRVGHDRCDWALACQIKKCVSVWQKTFQKIQIPKYQIKKTL